MLFKAHSRLRYNRIKTKIKHIAASVSTVFIISLMVVGSARYFVSTVTAAAPGSEPRIVEKVVPVIQVKEVDRKFKTEKQQIMAYIVEKFGDRASDMITIINQCENHDFKTDAINHNSNGSCDVGVTQENTSCSGEEFEKLKGWKYNIDEAYRKYHAAKDTFRPWTCAHVIGEKNYLNK